MRNARVLRDRYQHRRRVPRPGLRLRRNLMPELSAAEVEADWVNGGRNIASDLFTASKNATMSTTFTLSPQSIDWRGWNCFLLDPVEVQTERVQLSAGWDRGNQEKDDDTGRTTHRGGDGAGRDNRKQEETSRLNSIYGFKTLRNGADSFFIIENSLEATYSITEKTLESSY